VGFDPAYGARPLKRAIQKHLENGLAEAILAGRFKPGQVVVVDARDGGLVFEARDGAPRERKSSPPAAAQA
jgi:ATP-dependent Clp protease ATP-binding subunit ClpB